MHYCWKIRALFGALWIFLVTDAHGVDSFEDLTFSSDGLSLYAQVFLPDRGDNLPGIVLIQGAGASGTENRWARQYALEFSRRGYAVLLPDKRGVGRSEGDWRGAGFKELAADAVASLRGLEMHDRVAPGKVGFMGLSQGGHIAPIAAAQVTEIPFVISMVASLTTMEEQLYHELRNTYLQHQLDESSIDYLQSLARLSFAYLRDPAQWTEYLARRSEIAAGPMARAAETWPASETDPYWTFWRSMYDEDPLPMWRTLVEARNVPCLTVFGAEDEYDNVPVAASRERAAGLVKDPDFTLRVYPGSGHALYGPGTNNLRIDMLDETDRWLREALARHKGTQSIGTTTGSVSLNP